MMNKLNRTEMEGFAGRDQGYNFYESDGKNRLLMGPAL